MCRKSIMYTAHAGGCVGVGAKHEDLVLATCVEAELEMTGVFVALFPRRGGVCADQEYLDRFAHAVVRPLINYILLRYNLKVENSIHIKIIK